MQMKWSNSNAFKMFADSDVDKMCNENIDSKYWVYLIICNYNYYKIVGV